MNGSPTKTQILDEQKGRTQLANLTMSVVTLLVVLFFTGLLKDMPKASWPRSCSSSGSTSSTSTGLRRI